ncbi:hypothetical protein C2G38_2163196 [Gigaspora rosea]|uniref:Uncharacterized protein n=1 Tax=Gigaspora rosea TaxID=44941 RepID=A0A397VZT0_9GLOM|nr:hypothetical protein C2G38_2163196 [Gigaspora rosea]
MSIHNGIKNICGFFLKRRRTEPFNIYICRFLLWLFILLIMVGYTIIEAFNIMNEIPVMHTKYNESDFLPAPAVLISAPNKYSLEVSYKNNRYIIGNSTTADWQVGLDHCSKYMHKINNSVLLLPDANYTFTSEVSRKTLNIFSNALTSGVIFNDGSTSDGFSFSIYDQTLAPSTKDLKIYSHATFDYKFVKTLETLNKYNLIYNCTHFMLCSRNLRRVTMPSISNYLGIPSSQIEEYYIKLNLQTFSQSFGSTGNTPYYADIEIFYQNFLVAIEQEFKKLKYLLNLHYYALNLLSKLGGALTLALTVVVYLCTSWDRNSNHRH